MIFTSFLIYASALIIISQINAQPNPVVNVTSTWMAGSSVYNAALVYGPLGDAGLSYTPGARVAGCSAMTRSGPDKFYIFGGQSPTLGTRMFNNR